MRDGGIRYSNMLTTPCFELEKIAPNVWRFHESMGDMAAVDAYLVVGMERAALIDTLQSDLSRSLVDIIREITDKPVDVLITHGHPDHAGAEVRKLAETADFTLHMNLDDLPIAQKMFAPWFTPAMFKDIREGCKYELGGITLEAHRVAGHTPGSMVFLDRENKRCFTGDALGVWLQLDHSLPMIVYIEELKRFEEKLADIPDTTLWIGHAVQAPTGYFTADHVTNMRQACEMVLRGELIGTALEFPPHMADSPMAQLMKGAKIAQFKTVTGLTYREDRL